MNKFENVKNISQLNDVIKEAMAPAFAAYIEEHGYEALRCLMAEMFNKEQFDIALEAVKANDFEKWQEAIIKINNPSFRVWDIPGMEGSSKKLIEVLKDEKGMRDYFNEACKYEENELDEGMEMIDNAFEVIGVA